MFEGLRFKHWKTNVGDDGIVVLTFDREGASANALSREVLDELDTIVERLAIENPRGVVIHSAKPSGFAGGVSSAGGEAGGGISAMGGIQSPVGIAHA